MRNRDWADDMVQETFIRAWSHLTLLGLLSRPQRRAWLQRVLKLVFIDQHRRNVRERAALSGFAQQQGPPPVAPSRSLQIEELFATLPKALATCGTGATWLA